MQLLDLYQHCEALPTPHEVMSAILEAVGALALHSRDVEVVKELMLKLYSDRFAKHFSDAALCQALEQIHVILINKQSTYIEGIPLSLTALLLDIRTCNFVL